MIDVLITWILVLNILLYYIQIRRPAAIASSRNIYIYIYTYMITRARCIIFQVHESSDENWDVFSLDIRELGIGAHKCIVLC